MKFKPLVSTEHQECKDFVQWLKLNSRIWSASQTSANQAICYTNPGVRKKLAEEGLKAGEPDFMIRIMRGGYGGLFIEMKKLTEKGKALRPEQRDMHILLRNNGYRVEVAYGCWEAIDIVEKYMKLLDPLKSELYNSSTPF